MPDTHQQPENEPSDDLAQSALPPQPGEQPAQDQSAPERDSGLNTGSGATEEPLRENLSQPFKLTKAPDHRFHYSAGEGSKNTGWKAWKAYGKGALNSAHFEVEGDEIKIRDTLTGHSLNLREHIESILETGDPHTSIGIMSKGRRNGSAERGSILSLCEIGEAEQKPIGIHSAALSSQENGDGRFFEVEFSTEGGERHRLAIRCPEGVSEEREKHFSRIQRENPLSDSIDGVDAKANVLFLRYLKRLDQNFDIDQVSSISQSRSFAKPNFGIAAWTEGAPEESQKLKFVFDSADPAQFQICDLEQNPELLAGTSEGFNADTEILAVEGVKVMSNGGVADKQRLYYEVTILDQNGETQQLYLRRPDSEEHLTADADQYVEAPTDVDSPSEESDVPSPDRESLGASLIRRGKALLQGAAGLPVVRSAVRFLSGIRERLITALAERQEEAAPSEEHPAPASPSSISEPISSEPIVDEAPSDSDRDTPLSGQTQSAPDESTEQRAPGESDQDLQTAEEEEAARRREEQERRRREDEEAETARRDAANPEEEDRPTA